MRPSTLRHGGGAEARCPAEARSSTLELLVCWVGSCHQVAVQLAHRNEGVLAGAAPGGAQTGRRCRADARGSGPMWLGVGEVLIEGDTGRGEIVEEVANDRYGGLVEIGFQHAAAQHRDDAPARAGRKALGRPRSAHGAGAPEGVDGAGDGGGQQRGRVHLANERFQHGHAWRPAFPVACGRAGYRSRRQICARLSLLKGGTGAHDAVNECARVAPQALTGR